MDSTARFGSDHGALRSEDEPLLTGGGRFTDDLNVPGQAYGVFVRAPVSHARSAASMSAAARAMPGVLGVYSGQDRGGRRTGRDPAGRGVSRPRRQADVRRRDAGAGRATASATSASRWRSWWRETLAQAQDAAEAVRIEYDELADRLDHRARARGRCHADPRRAARQRRARLDRRQCARRWTPPSPAPRMSSACGSTTRGLRRSRWSRAPASDRSMRRSGRYTLIASTQGVAVVRKLLAEGVFKVPLTTIRVLTHDVGGGFGMKAQAYPEYARDPLCGAQGRPAGEMVQQPDGELPLRLGTGATAFWKASSRSTPRANSSRCACATSSASAPTRRSTPRSSPP